MFSESNLLPPSFRVSGFPRSIATYLSSIEFPPILNRAGKPPSFVDVSKERAINLELDLNTRLDTHEIIIQFMAISSFKNVYISNLPRSSRYFFTIRFYRFEQVTTEMLLAHPPPEWRRTDPIVFQRVDENGRLIKPQMNGFMIKFTVERCADSSDFVDYLLNGSLFIDVWNADSLIHLGASAIPLKVS
jgi:hypothetical protein